MKKLKLFKTLILLLILGKEIQNKVISINFGEAYRGVQIIKEQSTVFFKYLFIPYISTSKTIYWKPFKRLIAEAALPSLLENNRKGASPYVNVWFIIAKESNSPHLLDLKLEGKVNMGSDEHVALESLFKKVQTK